MLQLPGLIDPHVHLREPGATHKEDWDSGTCAALAGGFTTVLAMPNTEPPVVDAETLQMALELARAKARCDFALFLGANDKNTGYAFALGSQTAGLKMYLNNTYGPLRLDDMVLWMRHLARWSANRPVAVHAERHTLGAVILAAWLINRPVHLCHVSRREEILLIRAAKEKGLPITCEVTPHHLFLCEDDLPKLPGGRGKVAPALASASDRQALWENLDVIDCFATDHAPHTTAEKDSATPPPGFPGLETALPLFLTAVQEGRLSLKDVVSRMYTNPMRIFQVPEQAETLVEVDLDAEWEIKAVDLFTRCRWTPFEGWRGRGRVRRVLLRGKEAYRDGEVLALPGSGKNIREVG